MMVPDQIPSRTEEGLLVVVPGSALFEANKFFYSRHEMLVAQVHSHPTVAFHSSTDDLMPLATTEGSLSLVVPNFGHVSEKDLIDCELYRLTNGEWVHIDNGPTSLLLLER